MLPSISHFYLHILKFIYHYLQFIPLVSNSGDRLFLAPGIQCMQLKLSVEQYIMFYFRNATRLYQQLALSEEEVFTPAFVSFNLNHCNAFFASLPEHTINRLQLVPNVAAGILTGTRWSECVISLLSPSPTGCQSNFTLASRCSPWSTQPFKIFNHTFSLK